MSEVSRCWSADSRWLSNNYTLTIMNHGITSENDPCAKCDTPVVKQTHAPNWKTKPGQKYWFEYWFRCPKCLTFYLVEDAKRFDPVFTPVAQGTLF